MLIQFKKYIFVSLNLKILMKRIEKIKLVFIIAGLLIVSSCASKKDVVYFNDLDISQKDKVAFSASKTQVNDILNIIISSNSTDIASVYNFNQNTTTPTGYLVTPEGTVTLPILGKIKVIDLTLLEIESLVTRKLIDDKQLMNPIVIVRLINAKFTVIGEVNNPGTYTFNEQNISLLQAIGYAGDLTINGKRQDVLVIRQENDTKTYMMIDLTSRNWLSSPYYYVKPNDVIYVNPNGPKIKSAGYVGNLGTFFTIFSTALSTILTILILSKK